MNKGSSTQEMRVLSLEQRTHKAQAKSDLKEQHKKMHRRNTTNKQPDKENKRTRKKQQQQKYHAKHTRHTETRVTDT